MATRPTPIRKLPLGVQEWEALYGTRPGATTFSLRFMSVIRNACEKAGRSSSAGG